jgi:hypothetical protein
VLRENRVVCRRHPSFQKAPNDRDLGKRQKEWGPARQQQTFAAPPAPQPSNALFLYLAPSAVLSSSWLPTSPRSPSCSRPAWTPARTSRVRRFCFCCCLLLVPQCPSLPSHTHIHVDIAYTDSHQPSRPSPRSRPSPTSPFPFSTSSPPTRSPPQYGWPAPSTSRTSSSATGSTRMATTSCHRTRSLPSSAS